MLIFNRRLCNLINVLDKAIKRNVDMSQGHYQDLFWSLPSMDINVLLKLVRSGECFITFLAGIWFYPSMDPNVFL